MNKSLVLGIATTLLLAALLSIVFYNRYVSSVLRPIYDAIPNDASFYIEAKDWVSTWQLIQKTPIVDGLLKQEYISSAIDRVSDVTNKLISNAVLKKILSSNNFAVSFHAVNQKPGVLFVFQAEKNDLIESSISSVVGDAKLKVVVRIFEKQKIYDIQTLNGENIASIAYIDSYIICSTFGEIVENSIRKLRYKLHNEWQDLQQIYPYGSKNSSFQLVINYHNLSPWLDCFIKKSQLEMMSLLASWSILDIHLANDKIHISGATTTHDSDFQYLDVFVSQRPINWAEMLDYIPDNISTLVQIGFDDYASYKNDLELFDQFNQSKSAQSTNYAKSIFDKTGVDISINNQWIGDVAILGVTETSNADWKRKASTFLKINDIPKFTRLIEQLHTGLNTTDSSIRINTHKGKNIYYLPTDGILGYWLGPIFTNQVNSYVTIIDNVSIWSNSLIELKSVIDRHQNGYTLKKVQNENKGFSINQIASNLTIYINTPKLYSIFQDILNDQMLSISNRYMHDIKKFSALQVSYASSSDRVFHTRVILNYDPSFKEETRELWQFKPDTVITYMPVFVNLPGNQNKAIIMQDAHKQLYFISSSGMLKWKIKLSASIIGDIYEVQVPPTWNKGYLVATQNSILCFDTNGNSFTGFPIKLPRELESDLLVTDWFQDSTYLLYAYIGGNKLLSYNIQGKLSKGWSPLNLELTPASKFMPLIANGLSPRLLYTDQTGRIATVDCTGKQELFSNWPESEMHPKVVNDATMSWYWFLNQAYNIEVYQIDSNNLIQNNKVKPIQFSSTNEMGVVGNQVWIRSYPNVSLYTASGTKMYDFVEKDSMVHLYQSTLFGKGGVFGYVNCINNTAMQYNYNGVLQDGFPIKSIRYFKAESESYLSRNIACALNLDGNLIFYILK